MQSVMMAMKASRAAQEADTAEGVTVAQAEKVARLVLLLMATRALHW